MTLVSTYDPDSETHCPYCDELVHCRMLGGITFGHNPYLDFRHDECGTSWRLYTYSGMVQCPIPPPICGFCGKSQAEHKGRCEQSIQKKEKEHAQYLQALNEIRDLCDDYAGAHFRSRIGEVVDRVLDPK